MAFSNGEIEAAIREAVAPGFRENMLARGQARSMIWAEGVLPEGAPQFSRVLTYDLMSYGYSLLTHALRLLEGNGDIELARTALEHAASAIEAVVVDGKKNRSQDFHRLIAAAAYHIGQFSARAYSLIHVGLHEANLTEAETCLALLMLRDVDGLDAQIREWKLPGRGTDAALVGILQDILPSDEADDLPGDDSDSGGNGPDGDRNVLDVVVVALTDSYMSAVGMAMLGFERGESELVDEALGKLRDGLGVCAELNLVSQWWCFRLTIYLLGDLWASSFHRRLPPPVDDVVLPQWNRLRSIFIASLYRRSKAEIELWPSQFGAAEKALDLADNLVVSLPTSAGKTRIAELCILACLSTGRRVVFVTPLRALSAQTEVSLSQTFLPLGKTVSSLYGSIGASDVDGDTLRERDIIVATPEKLDFALRNDPTLLDDVGLVVLDEGHMIGLDEREVRYEVQIQRLLKRGDAADRRIVCLSAVLPSGSELDDFVAWLTQDGTDGLIKSDWRPTRLRFGEVQWKGAHGQLNIQVGDETPFVPRFVAATVPPKLNRKEPVPRTQRELCLATAWRLMDEGQSVLIFCPERRSVEPFATVIVDLAKRGVLAPVLAGSENELAAALAIGSEWFGDDHVLLKCLKLGVAIHHGALPTPYRKEIERLLRKGVLRLTVSSPTLAQGLNLAASTLVMFGLDRNGELIKSSEFRNIIGRAGRAYVDLEGLILYPMFDRHQERGEKWKELTENLAGREMESGLLRLLMTLLTRISKKLKTKSVATISEYVLNNVGAWTFPEVQNEKLRITASEQQNWSKYLTSLDTAILSMLGEGEVDEAEIEAKLDDVLAASLFVRRMTHRKESVRNLLKTTLALRAKYIWNRTTSTQRRGYFLAGLGFDTGQQLDAHAPRLEEYLATANRAIRDGNGVQAKASITQFAEIVFEVTPFIPSDLPENWREVLDTWLDGMPVAEVAANNESEVLQFIEGGLVYRLPWAMEAVRVRTLAHEDPLQVNVHAEDIGLGYAVAAVETGTLSRSAALLMRTGFSSRIAAIKAVNDTGADFIAVGKMRAWLKSAKVKECEEDNAWPSPESRQLWDDFRLSMVPAAQREWDTSGSVARVQWDDEIGPLTGTPLRVARSDTGDDVIATADYEPVGTLERPVNPDRRGLLKVTVGRKANTVRMEYLGPDDLYAE
ncbi:DEAD/DEAH box helicase [Paraburkholderia sp. RL17-337-BIB-A]|uniref:DEAD/DEAH box helicase n=1 Tax=Paraburkholderia sp. RL17-337-BIB-A TaxID=3031636 RepID=UPI0038B82D8B